MTKYPFWETICIVYRTDECTQKQKHHQNHISRNIHWIDDPQVTSKSNDLRKLLTTKN